MCKVCFIVFSCLHSLPAAFVLSTVIVHDILVCWHCFGLSSFFVAWSPLVFCSCDRSVGTEASLESFVHDALGATPPYSVQEMGPDASEILKRLSFSGRRGIEKVFDWFAEHKDICMQLLPAFACILEPQKCP